MRKFSTFVFLLLILMYIGTHASCYQEEAGSTLPDVVDYTVNP